LPPAATYRATSLDITSSLQQNVLHPLNQLGVGNMTDVAQRPSYEAVQRKVEVMDTPYDRWIASQGIDVMRGFFVENLYSVPLKWWERMGGHGVYVMLDGTGYMDDAYVVEIAPGKSLNPQRHIYEALVYVLSGRGATTVWQTKGAKQSFEWHGKPVRAIAQCLVPAFQRPG
jgi:hypothetical protein